MLITSGGNRVYCVFASSDQYTLAIEPSLQVVSQTAMLALRLRYAREDQGPFDPMTVPKYFLSQGIDRSFNTIRTTTVWNSKKPVSAINKAWPEWAAQRIGAAMITARFIYDAADEEIVYQRDTSPLFTKHIREDFVPDMTDLITQNIAGVYPPKDFTKVPEIVSGPDMNFMLNMDKVENVEEGKPVVIQDPKQNVTMLDFGKGLDSGDTEPDAG